jgi:voltage-gated potassium channel
MTAIFVGMNIGPQIPKNIKNHIVICNWHNNAESIITELHSKQAEPNLNIVIITDSNIDEIKRRYKYDKHVFVIDSDPTNHEVLLTKTRSHHAKSVIILIDPEHSDSDAKAALISLAITKCDHNISYKPRIIAEVMNPDKVQHLQDAGVDEWVCSAGFGLGIIAQTALYGKLSEVYQQLLSYSSDTNEIYLLDSLKYPEWFLERSPN